VSAPAEAGCFHCGEPLPDHLRFGVVVDGRERAVCCLGCRAAAELIQEAGLGDYYRFRTASAPRPEPAGAGTTLLSSQPVRRTAWLMPPEACSLKTPPL